MSSKGKFLKSIYTDEEVTAILEEAINISFQLHIIDNRNGRSFLLDIHHLHQIRQNYPHRGFLRLEEPVSSSLGGMHRIIGELYEQPAGYSDLRVDEENLVLIRAMFKPSQGQFSLIDQPRGGTEAEAVEEKFTEPEQKNKDDTEMEAAYWSNPADRNPKLFDEAVKIKMANPSWNFTKIRKQIFERQKGKSDVSMDSLKRIVKRKDIIPEIIKRREKLEEKQKVKE